MLSKSLLILNKSTCFELKAFISKFEPTILFKARFNFRFYLSTSLCIFPWEEFVRTLTFRRFGLYTKRVQIWQPSNGQRIRGLVSWRSTHSLSSCVLAEKPSHWSPSLLSAIFHISEYHRRFIFSCLELSILFWHDFLIKLVNVAWYRIETHNLQLNVPKFYMRTKAVISHSSKLCSTPICRFFETIDRIPVEQKGTKVLSCKYVIVYCASIENVNCICTSIERSRYVQFINFVSLCSTRLQIIIWFTSRSDRQDQIIWNPYLPEMVF